MKLNKIYSNYNEAFNLRKQLHCKEHYIDLKKRMYHRVFSTYASKVIIGLRT